MDTRTGKFYATREEMIAEGVPPKHIKEITAGEHRSLRRVLPKMRAKKLTELRASQRKAARRKAAAKPGHRKNRIQTKKRRCNQ